MTLALAVWKNFRDRQNAPALLESVRETSGADPKSRAREIQRYVPLVRTVSPEHTLWKRAPFHPSLHFEERRNGICVVRIGTGYRALGLREGDTIVWFWIGTHEEYNRFSF
jgi:hypothetical protein